MSYVETVAELFLKRSGNTLLEAADYVVIAEWEKEEIPLAVILETINYGFENSANKPKSNGFQSIGDLQFEVKKHFADWLKKLKDV